MSPPEAGWLPEALPQEPDELSGLPNCSEVVEAARRRGITEVLHFTTNKGAVGVLHDGAIRCRRSLPHEANLEFIYRPNAVDRSRDISWHGYVNLSISRINRSMFDSSRGWHDGDGISWVIFAFDPEILGDPGVVFATTNNAYPTVRRAEGVAGFEQLFRDSIPWGYYGSVHRRRRATPVTYTTDPQAEVLYPWALSLECLAGIYVQDEACLEQIEGLLGVFDLNVEPELSPEVFQ